MGLYGRRLTVVLATLLGVVVIVGAAAAFAVGRSQHAASSAPPTQPGTTHTSSAAPDGTPSATRSTRLTSSPATPPSASSRPAAPSGTPTASPSATPAAPVAVTLSARAVASADAQPVQDLLGRYFTAINQHDYDAWLATVSTEQAKRDRDDWNTSYDTTQDDDVYVSDIYRQASALLVRIQFVSHQAVDKAPKQLRADCIRWDVTYRIVDEGTGLRVGNSVESPSMARC